MTVDEYMILQETNPSEAKEVYRELLKTDPQTAKEIEERMMQDLTQNMQTLSTTSQGLVNDSINAFTTTTITSVVLSLVVTIVVLIAQWKMFKKASKPGWASLIPVYNTVCLFKIAKMNPWLILLFLVPIADVVILILLYKNLAKSFGKGIGYTLGLIFLTPIFTLMLGFGKAQYQD